MRIDYPMNQILWTHHLFEIQGSKSIKLGEYQDNQSKISMEVNVRAFRRKWT